MTDSRDFHTCRFRLGGANNWGELVKLTATDAAGGDRFGRSVSLSGQTALVGAYNNGDAGDFSGSAYIYTPIPEPQTLGLVLLGLTLLVGTPRRVFAHLAPSVG